MLKYNKVILLYNTDIIITMLRIFSAQKYENCCPSPKWFHDLVTCIFAVYEEHAAAEPSNNNPCLLSKTWAYYHCYHQNLDLQISYSCISILHSIWSIAASHHHHPLCRSSFDGDIFSGLNDTTDIFVIKKTSFVDHLWKMFWKKTNRRPHCIGVGLY